MAIDWGKAILGASGLVTVSVGGAMINDHVRVNNNSYDIEGNKAQIQETKKDMGDFLSKMNDKMSAMQKTLNQVNITVGVMAAKQDDIRSYLDRKYPSWQNGQK